ncbi:MAG TPA: hypothetical protein VGL24_01990, partial [Chthoniobacterales bacterium]
TGLTLLSSGNSEASGRIPSGMRMSGSRGMNNGAIHQSIGRNSNRGVSLNRGSDDRGRGRHDRGDDRGGKTSLITRGERERGDDHGRHRERGDDKGGKGNTSITRGEREPGDDHGRHHERGDDKGGGR